MPLIPPSEHICTVCGIQGTHWRVNCPVVREKGDINLFGAKKSKKFGKSGAEIPRDPEVDPIMDDEQGVTPDLLAENDPWSAAELDRFPMRASCLQQNVVVADLSPALQRRVWAYVAHLIMPMNPELPRALAICR